MTKRALPLLAIALATALVGGDEGRVPRDVRTELFSTSVVCAPCHNNQPDASALRDSQGRGIAPYDLWRSSMMANAARDPFFRAAVAAEVAAAPERKTEIEAKCLHCHAPMASVEARRAGKAGLAMADLDRSEGDEDDDRAALARDGVSCTLCHQILPDNLGSKESFDGGFEIGEMREIYGPHGEQFVMPMWRVAQYWPVEGKHMTRSEHCATCHTSYLGSGVPELAPYLEWRNSDFREAASCQSCHQPNTSEGGGRIRTRIAHSSHGGDIRWLRPQEPVGRHLFVGGNTLLPAILRDHADALHVKAPAAAFDRTIAWAREQLRERTARIEIEEVERPGETVEIAVSVENLAGHKFPTGHSSRRAWLRLRVRDKAGKIVFASGEHDQRGRILGRDGAPLPFEAAGGPIAPHRTSVTDADQVPVYEAVLGDGDGAAVFATVRASGFLKDNRLLPKGWSPKHADAAATAPAGVRDDEDFLAGADRILYEIAFPVDEEEFSVEAALLYQPLSPRHAAELFRTDDAEVRRFREYYEAADLTPVVVAVARLVVGDED